MTNPDDPFDDDWLSQPDDEPDEEPGEDRDPFVIACNTPNCCMPGPHFLSECVTPEMMDDFEEEMSS